MRDRNRSMKVRAFMLGFVAILNGGALSHARSVALPPAIAPIAWGEPAEDGIRIGLQATQPTVAEGAKYVVVDVCYENVGKKPAEVPVHVHEGVNSSRLMFKAESGGKQSIVGYVMTRLATAPPRSTTLKPGGSFREPLVLKIGKIGAALGYSGLPVVRDGDSLSLRVGLCAGIDPHREKDWEGALKSGSAVLIGVANPTKTRLAALKENLGSLRLRLQYSHDEPGGEVMPGLMLYAAPIEYSLLPNWDAAWLKPEAAEKLLEDLAADGFFRQANSSEGKFAKVGYVLHLETDATAFHQILGEPDQLFLVQSRAGDDSVKGAHIAGPISAELISGRLTALHRSLEGGAKNSFDRFLAKLANPVGPIGGMANSNVLLKEYKGKVTVKASSFWITWEAEQAIDGDPKTSWFTASGDSAANGRKPWIEVRLPADETVRRVTILGNREPAWPKGFSVLEGVLDLRDKGGKRLWLDEQVAANATRDFDFRPAEPVQNVRSIRFYSTRDEGDQTTYKDIALGEIQIE